MAVTYVTGSSGMTNDQVRAQLGYEITSNTNTKITYTLGVYVYGNGPYTTSGALSTSLSCSGQTTYTTTGGSCNVTTGTRQQLMSNKTYTFDKTTSTYTRTINFSLKSTGSTISGTSSGSLTVTIPTLTKYTVSYNANGGSGTVSSQTKYYGVNLTLRSNSYTRTGYAFSKWNTKAGGSGTAYSAGGTYKTNAKATMYAQWTANTYTVTLNANGGSSNSSVTRTYGSSFTIPASKIPTRTNYNFLGWSTSSTAKTASYTHTGITSGSCTISVWNTTTGAKTLYAVWELAYINPSISNLIAYRCDSGGTQDDDGEYIHVQFNWTGGKLNNSYRSPYVKVKIDEVSVYDTGSVESTTTGSFSNTYGSAYSVNFSHDVSVEVYDPSYTAEAYKAIAHVAVPSANFPIDILADGSAMGVMTPAVAGQTLKLFVDAIYPVGCYYETSKTPSQFDPNTYFGGTWSLETEGQVHVSGSTSGTYRVSGANNNTTDGGEAKHTLQKTEIPEFEGSVYIRGYKTSSSASRAAIAHGASGIISVDGPGSSTANGIMAAGGISELGSNPLTISFGGGQSHNNLQPYIVVYRWHRTA